MRQLTLTAPSTTVWQDVGEPDLQGPGEALVRPSVVARCDLGRPTALARALGRGAVSHVDDDPARLALAADPGAEAQTEVHAARADGRSDHLRTGRANARPAIPATKLAVRRSS